MIPVIPTNCKIDDINLQKMSSIQKIDQVLSLFDEKKMIKTASADIDKNSMISLFMNMLACLNIKTNENDVEALVNRISNTTLTADSDGSLNKQATQNKTSQERKDEIKIVSKSIKDSHYQVDVSKDMIVRNGKNVFMVSCYARDAYLGRYLIKRNFFYTASREKFADNAYDEIKSKINAIKERYYSDVIDVSALFSQMKQTLDGVISEIKIEDDSISTNINR